ncbi:DUF6236 family protein [Cellulomonas sp. P5_C6]
MLNTPALYFPYIHVRDDDWLKTAALYWPSVRRLVPHDYPKHDTDTARTFAEHGLLVDEDPAEYLDLVAWDLVDYLRVNASDLRDRYNVWRVEEEDWPANESFFPSDPTPGSPGLGWIHLSKFSPRALQILEEQGLAIRGRKNNRGSFGHGSNWIGLHPLLAGAYMTALTGKVSEAGGFQPLTDQDELRRATPTNEAHAALRLLTGRKEDVRAASDSDAVANYVMLAVQTVRPTGLALVPAEKIVECRRDLQVELDNFRSFVAKQLDELSEIAALPIERRRLEQFSEHVARSIEQPLRKLEKELLLRKMAPVRSFLMASKHSLPASAAAVLSGAPASAVATGGVAVAAGGAWWDVQRQRAAAKASSDVGYLLDVRDRLTPHTVVRRAKKLYTGTY